MADTVYVAPAKYTSRASKKKKTRTPPGGGPGHSSRQSDAGCPRDRDSAQHSVLGDRQGRASHRHSRRPAALDQASRYRDLDRQPDGTEGDVTAVNGAFPVPVATLTRQFRVAFIERGRR